MKKEIRSVLKMRAIAMAKEKEQKKKISETTEVIKFTLASETYAIGSAFVREVYPLKDFTALPGVPSFILGIINVRGQILPLLELNKFFNLPVKGLGELKNVIILQNDRIEFGILADIIHGTQTMPVEDILEAPPSVTGIGEKYLRGVTNDHIIVLDAANILNDEKIIVNEEVK